MSHACMKLGKRPPRIDHRTLRFANYLKDLQGLPPRPAVVRWGDAVHVPWGMMLNDKIGDCTIAGAGHEIVAATANHGRVVVPSDPSILKAYCAISGYDPRTGANDDGASLLDVLKFWHRYGIAGHQIGGYVAVEPSNHDHVCEATYLFGAAYIGVNLPISAQTQEDTWDVTDPSLSGDAAPRSWGGHCVSIVNVSLIGVDVVSWGKIIHVTWKFFDAYVDEVFAKILFDWVSQHVTAPNRFSLPDLQSDIRNLAA